MKKFNAFLVSVFATVVLNAAVIEQVIVRQQWPWSTDVKVEYKLSAVTNPVDISVRAYNGDVELSLPAAAITGDRYGISEDGVGAFVIDPVAAFGTEKVALANFKVKLAVSDSSENIHEVLYKIFDLENGNVTPVTRSDLLDGKYGSYETDFGRIGDGYSTKLKDVLIWTGVTNDVKYKSSHLVMRRIPAGSFKLFDAAAYPDRIPVNDNATFDKDYYIGVFELTQAQYAHINGLVPSNFAPNPEWSGDYLPMMNIGMPAIYGAYNTSVVSPSSGILRELRNRFGESAYPFYTSTQAQFFRALIAGTETYYHDGISGVPTPVHSNERMNALALYRYNGGCAGPESQNPLGPIMVGSKRPNAYGLYDMYGNVGEATCEKTVLTTEQLLEGIVVSSAGDAQAASFVSSWWEVAETKMVNGTYFNEPKGHNRVGVRLCYTAP